MISFGKSFGCRTHSFNFVITTKMIKGSCYITKDGMFREASNRLNKSGNKQTL